MYIGITRQPIFETPVTQVLLRLRCGQVRFGPPMYTPTPRYGEAVQACMVAVSYTHLTLPTTPYV